MSQFRRVDRARVEQLLERERAAWIDARPRSRALCERARRSQLHGTPQHWIDQYPPPFPIVVERAEGATIHDVDGHAYADLGLCGTAALWGHTNPAVVAALREQLGRGTMTGWQSEDHVWVTEELQRRFGLPYWQFTVSATDANRFALRLARVVTGRERIVVFNGAYHGSVDEAHAVPAAGGTATAPGVAPNGVDLGRTTRVVEFNDLDAVRRALAPGDVAAVITEPALTNGGALISAVPGFHAGLREATRRHGALLIVDETQTITAGPGGCTRDLGLEPDVFTMGKSIAAGIPAGIYGMTEAVAAAAAAYTRQPGLPVNHGGFGSTLAAGDLALRAMRAVLHEVMTEDGYAWMHRLAEAYERGVRGVVDDHDLPWHVARLGGRVALAFVPEPPQNGGQLGEAVNDHRLRELLWLYLANRGVALAGYDGTAIFSPVTDEAAVELHNALFADGVAALVAD
jgi:glutamate-1-semialdehyde 2,1-aminomutase